MFEIKPILNTLLRHKSSTLLIMLQIAITFAVVVNATSIIKQRITLMERVSGLDESRIIALSVTAIAKNYDLEQNIREDIKLLRNTPGVIDAVAINQIPLSGSGDSSMVASSQKNYDNQVNIQAGFFRSDSHIISTMGVKLLAGRNFTEDEVEYTDASTNSNVILVTKSLADKVFPDGDALGKTLYYGYDDATIIGIIEQMSGSIIDAAYFEDNVIVPAVKLENFNRILIRAEITSLEDLLGNIEKLLLERNSERVIGSVHSLKEIKNHSYRKDIAMAKILWLVITLLIVITALGIVGIVSFNVNQRIKQIGTRRALGARKVDIQRYFITENLLVTTLGLLIGTLLTVFFNVYLVDTYSISPLDWRYIPIGMLAMLLIGIIAVWIPAQKASAVSPALATQSI